MSAPRTIPARKLQRIARLLHAARWIFAKTMPENPHEYTLRREWARDEEFVEVVQAIRQLGHPEVYQGNRYTVLDPNGWKYWTMGAPLSRTVLINRKGLRRGGEGKHLSRQQLWRRGPPPLVRSIPYDG